MIELTFTGTDRDDLQRQVDDFMGATARPLKLERLVQGSEQVQEREPERLVQGSEQEQDQEQEQETGGFQVPLTSAGKPDRAAIIEMLKQAGMNYPGDGGTSPLSKPQTRTPTLIKALEAADHGPAPAAPDSEPQPFVPLTGEQMQALFEQQQALMSEVTQEGQAALSTVLEGFIAEDETFPDGTNPWLKIPGSRYGDLERAINDIAEAYATMAPGAPVLPAFPG